MTGPPPEWRYPSEKKFADAPNTQIAVMFVIDVSFSMDETEPTQDMELSGEAKSVHNELTRRLDKAGAELGALTMSLIWNETDDLDLHCNTVSGEHIYFVHKRSDCGGELDVDMNAGTKTTEPVENIYWIKAPVGRYDFWVNNINKNAVNFWIREKHKGVVKMHRGCTDQANHNSHHFHVDYVDPLSVQKQTRLQTTIDCICSIIKDQLKDEDQVGLMTFATDVQTDVPLTQKQGREAELLQKVKAMRTRGKTKFYGAVSEAANALAGKDPNIPKWIVALTDGKDTESEKPGCPNYLQQAADAFGSTTNLNFALISLGDEVERHKVNKIVEGCQRKDNKGMVVNANSIDEVKTAFEQIAEEIAVPSGGAM